MHLKPNLLPGDLLLQSCSQNHKKINKNKYVISNNFVLGYFYQLFGKLIIRVPIPLRTTEEVRGKIQQKII